MTHLKSVSEIALMRKAGLVVWEAHQVAAKLVRPGVTTAEINVAVEKFLASKKALPLFKGVKDPSGKIPFPAAACISVNDQVVHGIPGPLRLVDGDIVTIDIGCKLNGWCGDAAVTHPVGRIDPDVQQLLTVTEGALKLAIKLMSELTLWSEIAKEIERYIKRAGFSVVEGLVGHGIGRELWESPQVPNYYTRQYELTADFQITPGLVIAVEPMVNLGAKKVRTLPDQWTIATQDGLPSAHFEHTIAITAQGPQILTVGLDGSGWAIGG